MMTYYIYPKEGEKFSLAFEKLGYSPDGFILYDERHEPSTEAFLVFDAIAAIIPSEQRYSDKVEALNVRLKNDHHFTVHAHVFDLTQPPSVKFYTRIENHSELHEVKNIYVATSEVIAIAPSLGLRADRLRSFQGD